MCPVTAQDVACTFLSEPTSENGGSFPLAQYFCSDFSHFFVLLFSVRGFIWKLEFVSYFMLLNISCFSDSKTKMRVVMLDVSLFVRIIKHVLCITSLWLPYFMTGRLSLLISLIYSPSLLFLFPLTTTSLFSVSMSLFLFCFFSFICFVFFF